MRCLRKLLRLAGSLLLLAFTTCQPTQRSTRFIAENQPANPSKKAGQNWQCQRVIWRAYNTNYYDYEIDTNHRLTRCTAYEKESRGVYDSFVQTLSYTPAGQLDQVRHTDGYSRYRYRKGRLASIEFVQGAELVYRYEVTVSETGQIVGLSGKPLNDSGLAAFSTRYKLDNQGRYVELETRTASGELYYRVVQRDFATAVRGAYDQFRLIPYDVNMHPWTYWGEQFPMTRELAGQVDVYRYAAPETPTTLIKRSATRFTYQTNQDGYATARWSHETLMQGRDTVSIEYQNCH